MAQAPQNPSAAKRLARGRKPSPQTAEQRCRAVDLRRQGYSLREIAFVLGITLPSAAALLRRSVGRQVVAGVLRCRSCGAAIAEASSNFLHNGRVLCLHCLDRHPRAAFAERVKSLRVAAGYTLLELAHRSGVAAQQLWLYESGRQLPRPHTLRKLAAVLGPAVLQATQ